MINVASSYGITVEIPRAFGFFHILCLALLLAVGVILVRALDSVSDRAFRRAMLIIWITLLVLDLYKQISYDLIHIDEYGNIIYDYYWYAFPFQLCSTPLYVLPFIAFMREGRVRDGFVGFLAFFSFVGGLFVLILPETCFTDRLYVNIQTMLHHGMQVIISVLLVRRYKEKNKIRLFLDGLYVFLAFVGIALLLNIMVNCIFGEAVYGFNMFYIGPFYLEVMPALSAITTAVPYPVYLIGYTAIVSVASYLSYQLLRATVGRQNRESCGTRVKK